MPLNTMKNLLIEQLDELYAAEKHSTNMLPKLAGAAASPKLALALRSQADQTEQHVSRLEGVFDDLGVSSRPVESAAMKGRCQDCIKLAEMPNADPRVRDAAIIAAAQHVQHDQIAGYGCARAWATLLGHTEVASRLQKSLLEERKADTELTRLAESLNKAAIAVVPA